MFPSAIPAFSQTVLGTIHIRRTGNMHTKQHTDGGAAITTKKHDTKRQFNHLYINKFDKLFFCKKVVNSDFINIFTANEKQIQPYNINNYTIDRQQQSRTISIN